MKKILFAKTGDVLRWKADDDGEVLLRDNPDVDGYVIAQWYSSTYEYVIFDGDGHDCHDVAYGDTDNRDFIEAEAARLGIITLSNREEHD